MGIEVGCCGGGKLLFGHMMARKRSQEIQEARQKLEEVCIFLEEDLHSAVL
jgi:hypothetical protein